MRPPYFLYYRSHPVFIIATVAVALFSDLFLYGIVVPILPFILQDRVGLPQSEIQSTTSGLLAAYAVASFVFSPPAGLISDRVKTRRVPFLAGLIALGLSTLLLFLGQSVPVLVIARLLQGISGAVCWTSGLALVVDTVDGPNQLGQIFGTIFSIIGVGELAAPVLGGILYEKAGYVAVFGLSIAILALDVIFRVLLIEKKVALKYEGTITAYTKSRERSAASSSDEENGESRSQPDQPLLSDPYKLWVDEPKGIRRHFPVLYCLDARLLCALFLAFVQATLLAVFDATLPLQVKEQFGFSTLQAGLSFVPLQVPYLILGPVAGWLVDHYGPRLAAVLGFGWLVPTLILLRIPNGSATIQIVILGIILALCGIGMATIGSPAIVEASEVVRRYDEANPGFFGPQGPFGQLYSLNSMIFNLGLAAGTIAGPLREAIGYGNQNLVAASLCAATAVLAFIYVGRSKK